MATTPKGIYYPNDYNEIADIPEDMKKMAESIDGVFEDTDSDLSDIQEEQTTQNNRLNSLEVDNTTNKSDILTNKQEINNIKTEQTTQNANIQTNADNISALTSRVTETEEDISDIQEEQAEQNTAIENNATNIETLQAENENLKKIVAQMPQVEGQGTEVTLENTIEAQFTKFDVEGNSEQETTEGRNIFNKDKISTVYLGTNDDGVITSTTTTEATTTNVMPYFPNISVSNGDKIYLSCDIKLNSGSTGGLGALNDGVNTGYSAILAPTLSTTYQRYQTSFTYTADTNINKMLIQIRSLVGSVTIKDIMISKSSSSEFEKYTNGASPNPNYEQPILSSGDNGSINEKILNKNWFNKNSNFKSYVATVTPIDTGIKVENNDGGTYRSVWCEIGKDELLGKTLTIQTSISTYNGAIPRIIVVFNNETAQYIEQIKTITTSTEGTLVNIPNLFPENADRVSLIFYCSFTSATPKGSYVEYKDLQVELGSTATSFVEHKEQDYSIFVQQPMRSIGDVRDCFVKKSDGKLYERHYISKVVLDGTESWNLQNNCFTINISDIKKTPNYEDRRQLITISNYYIAQTSEYRGQMLDLRVCKTIDPGLPRQVSIKDTSKTLAEFKAMLVEKYANGKPVYVNYLLAEPLDLPCTETQIQQLENKPSTYKDFTIIQSEDETEAYLEVSGIYDMNKLITRVEVIESEV